MSNTNNISNSNNSNNNDSKATISSSDNIPVNEESVSEKFISYCRFGDKSNPGEMDSNMFAKLAKECGFIAKGCTKTDIDLIFTRSKPKGGRRIDFKAFKAALTLVSEKRFPKTFKEKGAAAALGKVWELVVKSEGPLATATKADKVKWHDDKTTYTGVYKAGGPTNVDKDKIVSLSQLADRSEANPRGIKKKT